MSNPNRRAYTNRVERAGLKDGDRLPGSNVEMDGEEALARFQQSRNETPQETAVHDSAQESSSEEGSEQQPEEVTPEVSGEGVIAGGE